MSIISGKIYERFKSCQQAFRYLDTDHSQSLSVNEFAQAIEYLRLKLSFDDIVKVFNFLDINNNKEIGYEEFTLLMEERWRGLDPLKQAPQKK